MKSLDKKRVQLIIADDEGCLVEGSLFTNYALTKNYGVNIHKCKDDDDICFIFWLQNDKLCFL